MVARDGPGVTANVCHVRHLTDDVGARAVYRNRITGQHVIVFDGRLTGDLGDRWRATCEAHRFTATWATLAGARLFAAMPEQWCELCTGEWDPAAFDSDYVPPED